MQSVATLQRRQALHDIVQIAVLSLEIREPVEDAPQQLLQLGDHAQRLFVSSTKSATGHTLGAAGGLEFAFCALAVRDGMIPPTINYQTPDPECDLNYVPNVAVKHEVDVALSNSFGFGGHNCTLAVRRFRD